MITEYLTVSPDGKEGDAVILHAAQIIQKGGLVCFPTETVYGLGADATNAEAAAKIYAAKGRPSDNPLIIHIANPEDAEKYTECCELYYHLAKKYMPGPITVVLPAKPIIPLQTRGGLPTVAVRCPSNPVAHRLIELAGTPIAAPSANLSGSPSPTTAKHVFDDMNGRVDCILAGGDASFGLESTIVKIDGEELTLLRPGKITVDALSEIAPVKIADAVIGELKPGEVALSPGMKYRHYAPKAPLYLLDMTREDAVRQVGSRSDGKVALLCYSEDMDFFRSACPDTVLYDFGSKDNRLLQAHRLFFLLREADKIGYARIFAPLPSKDGIGLALYNRMIRAAAHQIIRM